MKNIAFLFGFFKYFFPSLPLLSKLNVTVFLPLLPACFFHLGTSFRYLTHKFLLSIVRVFATYRTSFYGLCSEFLSFSTLVKNTTVTRTKNTHNKLIIKPYSVSAPQPAESAYPCCPTATRCYKIKAECKQLTHIQRGTAYIPQ